MLKNSTTATQTKWRRMTQCIAIGLAVTMSGVVAVPGYLGDVKAAGQTRTISMYFTHTKEKIRVTYKRDGQYVPSAMRKINKFLRDWRSKTPILIDPQLVDLLWELHTELGAKKPIHIISGFRSPKTNKMLKRIGRNVASRSLHLRGKAADVYFPDVPLKKLRESALLRERGGVGYYPRSGKYGFVHIDTGSVRHWPRMKKQQLARLFRNKKTRQRPAKQAPILLAKRTKALQVANAIPIPRSNPVRLAALLAKPGNSGTLVAQLDKPTSVVGANLASAPSNTDGSTAFVRLDQPAGIPDKTRSGFVLANSRPITIPDTDPAAPDSSSGEITLASLGGSNSGSDASIVSEDLRAPPPPVVPTRRVTGTVPTVPVNEPEIGIDTNTALQRKVASLSPAAGRSGSSGLTEDIAGLSSQDQGFRIMRAAKSDRRDVGKLTQVASLAPVSSGEPFTINRAHKSDFGIAQLIQELDQIDSRTAPPPAAPPASSLERTQTAGGNAPSITGSIAKPRKRPTVIPASTTPGGVPLPRRKPGVTSTKLKN